METLYNYTISSDTLNSKVDINSLRDEIENNNSILIAISRIIDDGSDNLEIYFKTTLSAAEQLELTSIVNSHEGIETIDEILKYTLVDSSGTAIGSVEDNGVQRLALDLSNTLTGPQGPQGIAGDAGPSGFGVYAFSKTAADGTILKARGLNIAKAGTGSYDYTFTTPTPDADYAVTGAIFNLPTNTDTNIFVNNPTVNGFNITIGQGDNGTSLDTLMDEIHSIVVLGDAGPQGITSAYEAWLNVGNTGTEQDFLDTLVGPQGPTGATGPQGPAGDSQIRVSSNDSTVGFIEDKFVSSDNKISITTINEGADEDIQIQLQPSNIGTSELNNDANFIDATGAPVQSSDIADFETTTQLNTRDTNNRNRSFHTGTQLAATISDFTAAVQNAETTTSLSFNSGTNTLSYTDESGTVTNLDLSLFLDDTNLSQIVSGTLNGVTGIATFTRDDLTTFDVDFSALNDQSFINAAIATHETTIDNHDDVDTTTTVPVVGSKLRWDGSNWVPFLDFKDFVSTTTPAGTQGTTFVQYLRLSTTIPATGNYKICWNYEWSLNTTGSDFEGRVELDDTTTLSNHVEEPQDAGGGGITVTNLDGGTFDTGTNQRREESGFDVINLTAGSHTIDIDLANSVADTEATIYRASITVERWES